MNGTLIYYYTLTCFNIGLTLMTFAVLTASFFPSLDSFLKYGKTLQQTKVSHNLHLPFNIENLYVPKKWFTHFYIIHLILSITNFYIFFVFVENNTFFTDLNIICIFNLIQSSRRLYECIYVSKFSTISKIHIFHYVVGLIFYISVDIIPLLMLLLNNELKPNFLNCLIAISIFIFFSFDQWKNHNILSKQKKYSLSNRGFFNYLLCPHYLDESMIYFSMFVLKPSFSYFIIFLWVVINLSVSAKQSYIFYKSKNIDITKHYIIIPFLY